MSNPFAFIRKANPGTSSADWLSLLPAGEFTPTQAAASWAITRKSSINRLNYLIRQNSVIRLHAHRNMGKGGGSKEAVYRKV